MSAKPCSPASERNRDPILQVLRRHFADHRQVLEIGSGTGQHAVHFAAAMPWLTWQCSDVAENLPGIGLWLDEAKLANTPAAIALHVSAGWPHTLARQRPVFDAIFSANTLHIMGWTQVQAFFSLIGQWLDDDGVLVVYGPFNYGGDYTSASNRDFDGWLKARDAESGIRDFEAVDMLARDAGLRLVEDVPMPANNRCLIWRKEL